MPHRRPVDDMGEEERKAYLEEGQHWFDEWGRNGYPADGAAIARAYELLGFDQAMQLAAQLRANRRRDVSIPLVDLGVEEALEIAEEWEAGHDGQPYHAFDDPVECIIEETMRTGGTMDDEDYKYEFAWHVPNIAHAFLFRGSQLYDEDKFEEALEWELRAVKANPASAIMLLEIAECHKKLGNIDEGYEYACKALDVAWKMSDVAKARRTMAFFEGELGNYDAAAANLFLSNDYEPSFMAIHELQWLRTKGWTGDMSVERALEIAPEPSPEGIAVSPVVVNAYGAAAAFARVTGDADLGQRVMQQMLLAARGPRTAMRAKAAGPRQ